MGQKNFLKIPASITDTLENISGTRIVVGCLAQLKATALSKGTFSHLHIHLEDSGLQLPSEPVLPPASSGRYSKANVEGKVIVRRDLPIETHYTSVESPNFGDHSKGTHTSHLPHKRYPRDFVAPRHIHLLVDSSDLQPGLVEYAIRFRLDRILDRTASHFLDELLFDINLLQENAGVVGVYAAEATMKDYYKEGLHVAWELFPPGTSTEVITRVLRGQKPGAAPPDSVEDRLSFLKTLEPQRLIIGHSGFQRYFGAMIKEDLVLFENVDYGNAIYIMFNAWKELSQRSRTELLSGKFGRDFERVKHRGDWKSRVKSIVSSRRQ
ncbi:MAG: hypothetical protein EOO70_00645 [Myxococcaceae bacterium]|nr:MAG: hypothetical protein EOO70_00645 [Myxococcaceae bacterium]